MIKKPTVTANTLLHQALDFDKSVNAVSTATILIRELVELLKKDPKPSKAELLLMGMRIKIYTQSVTNRLFTIGQPEEFLLLSKLFKIVALIEIYAETL